MGTFRQRVLLRHSKVRSSKYLVNLRPSRIVAFRNLKPVVRRIADGKPNTCRIRYQRKNRIHLMVHPCDDKAQFMTAEFSNHAMHLEGTVSSHLDLHIPRAASREVTMVTPIPITSSAAAAVSITTVNTVTSSNESVGLDDPVIETMLDTCESSPSHFPRGISPDDNSCETGSRGNPRSSTQRNYKKRKHGMETFEQVRFHDVVGHGAVKMRIEEMLLPLALPPLLSAKVLTGIRALPASILLYGPPGCGKVGILLCCISIEII